MNKKSSLNRQVATDQSLENGCPANIGELMTAFTVTRAFRGSLLAQTDELLLLYKPVIVWTADPQDVNHGESKYFITGKTPKAVNEEVAGDLVLLTKAGLDYVTRHGIGMNELPGFDTLACVMDQNLMPKPGTVVHVCTSTHEFRGQIKTILSELVELDEQHCAMVNEISDGQFSNVLKGVSKGEDHVSIRGVSVYWHAIMALVMNLK